MATLNNVTKRITRMVNAGKFYFGQSENAAHKTYTRHALRWVTVYEEEKSPWGQGPNEYWETAREIVLSLLAGKFVTVWPTSLHEWELVSKYNCNIDQVAVMRQIMRHGTYEDFDRVRHDRPKTSLYFFANPGKYHTIQEATNGRCSGKSAAWWATVTEKLPAGKERFAKRLGWLLAIGLNETFLFESDAVVEFAVEIGTTHGGLAHECLRLGISVEAARCLRSYSWQEIEQDSKLLKNRSSYIKKDLSFPVVTDRHRREIVLINAGVSPADCSGGLLSNKEAMEWLNSPIVMAREWLLVKYGLPLRIHAKSRLLIEWLGRKWNTRAFTKTRTVYGPGGNVKEFTYRQIADEITEEDLVNGIKTKPDTAFKGSAKRLEALYLAEIGEDVVLPVRDQKETHVAGIHQIVSSKELLEEGQRMHNCVGGYINACLRERSFIYHVTTGGYNATAEVIHTQNGWVTTQLYGEGNTEPHPQVSRTWEIFCRKNKIHKEFYQGG